MKKPALFVILLLASPLWFACWVAGVVFALCKATFNGGGEDFRRQLSIQRGESDG